MSVFSLVAQATDYYSNTESLYNDSSYQYATQQNPEAAAAVAAASVITLLVVLVASVVMYVVSAFFLSRIFKKAGEEPWKAWVPVYNTWVLLELGDQKGYWSVLAFIPPLGIVTFVFLIMAEYKIGLKLGKEGAFVLLAVFLPLVWIIWLALDKSTWEGKDQPVAANGAPAVPPTTPVEPEAPKDTTTPPSQTPPTV
jgi:hypothetical protein